MNKLTICYSRDGCEQQFRNITEPDKGGPDAAYVFLDQFGSTWLVPLTSIAWMRLEELESE